MASPAGRGAQVILTGTQQSAARGVVGPEITVNLETKRVLEFAGTVADGTTLDGSTRTGLPAVDTGVVTLGVPTLSAVSLVEQSLPGQTIGLLVGLTTGSRRHLAANAGGRVALSGGEDRLVVGTTASVAADGALKVVLRETMGAQTRDTILIVTVVAYDSATTALLAAMTGAPAAYVAGAYDRFARGLKASTIWNKADLIYVPSHDDQASRLNWKAPGTFTGTKTGTLTFAPFKGFTSDGSTGYISTGWLPGTNAVNYTLNDAGVAWFVQDNVGQSTAFDVGCGTGLRLTSRTGLNMAGMVNSGTSQVMVPTNNISTGLNAAMRRSAAAISASKDAAPATDFANASTAMPTLVFKICGNISSSYSPHTIGFVYLGASLTDAELVTLNGLLEAYMREVGTWITTNAYTPGPSLSTDSVTYGSYTSGQIPAVAVVGTRRFKATYGVPSGLPAGTAGELPPCYVRLQYSDDKGANYSFGAAWIPDNGIAGAVLDPHLFAMADGKLILAMPYNGNGIGRNTYMSVLTNPTAPPASWVWNGPYLMSEGFVGTMYQDGPDIMYTLHQTGVYPYTSATPNKGNIFARLRFCGPVPVHVRVSRIPDAANGTMISFYETSLARRPDASIFATFRVSAAGNGYNYYTTSNDNGATWAEPAPYTAVYSPTTRACLAKSPTGNQYIAHNNHPTARGNISLTLLSPDCLTAVRTFLLDGRGVSGVPRATYPDVAFNGSGTSLEIYVDWDCGRGVQDPPTYTDEFMAAIIPEAGMLTGNPTKTTYTATN